MRVLGFSVLVLLSAAAPRFPAPVLAQAAPSPTIDELVNLKRVASPVLSPDGKTVAFTVRETNWEENAFETEDLDGGCGVGPPRQLTQAPKSSLQPAFAPDGRTLGFVSDRDGERQIYRIDIAGGEAERLTSARMASRRSPGRRTASRSPSRHSTRRPRR